MLDDGTMDIDILIRPLDEDVQSRIGDAAAWPGYAGELRDVLDICIRACGAGSMRISGLALSGPLPEDQAWLREGVSVPAGRAAEVFVEMMGRSDGAKFSLVGGDVLRIEESWDGVVFVPAVQAVWDALEDALDDLPEEHLEVGWTPAQPAVLTVENPVEVIADDGFWSAVRAAAGAGTTLLGERWALGSGGIRWFLLSPENVDEVIAGVEPGSLIGVAVDPDLRVRVLDHGFTAFTAPLRSGALVHHDVWAGVDDDAEIAEVTGAGFDLFLADAGSYAVVPCPDGELRKWEDPTRAG